MRSRNGLSYRARYWRVDGKRTSFHLAAAASIFVGMTLGSCLGGLAAHQAFAEPLRVRGDAGVISGNYLVVANPGDDGIARLATHSLVDGNVVDSFALTAPEFLRVPIIDAWADTVVVGANGHDPDTPLVQILRVSPKGAISKLTDLSSPKADPCLSMTFAMEGPEEQPHLTVLCQEGSGAVLVSEGKWPEVALSQAFRFDLSAETLSGTAVLSKPNPRSALVAIRGIEGSGESWALASLTEGNRVSPIISDKADAPVRVIAGRHPRLDRLILTGDPGLDATIGFDDEGQGGWRFLPPFPQAVALMADTFDNWLAISWAEHGTPLPFSPDSAVPIRIALYDLDAIAAEDARPQPPVATLPESPVSRIWLGGGALVATSNTGVTVHALEDLAAGAH